MVADISKPALKVLCIDLFVELCLFQRVKEGRSPSFLYFPLSFKERGSGGEVDK
jgi:hypothetical protein